MSDTTHSILISEKNYLKIKDLSAQHGCSVTFLSDLAMQTFFRTGIDITALRTSMTDAFDDAITASLLGIEKKTGEIASILKKDIVPTKIQLKKDTLDFNDILGEDL